jgi:hypothetical protein
MLPNLPALLLLAPRPEEFDRSHLPSLFSRRPGFKFDWLSLMNMFALSKPAFPGEPALICRKPKMLG